MTGLIIAIEGINGCGKSTIIKHVEKHFKSIGKIVKVYKFPDRSGFGGNRIDMFLQKKYKFAYKYDMFDAFTANRLATKEQIISDLKNDIIVICDRYIASGIAYHIPFDSSDFTIKNYYNIISYFDKDMPIPHITYLINGNYLHLRNEDKQIYHYNIDKGNKLFNIFKKIIPKCTNKFTLLYNSENQLNEIVMYIVNDILQHQMN